VNALPGGEDAGIPLIVGAGCFWTVQGVLDEAAGLGESEAGYVWLDAGGGLVEMVFQPDPRWQRVEVVRVDWDPAGLPSDVLRALLAMLQMPLLSSPPPPAYRPLLVAPPPWGEILSPSGRVLQGGQVAFLPAGDDDQHRARHFPGDGYVCEQVLPRLWKARALFPAHFPLHP
jgi:hypothetical protein